MALLMSEPFTTNSLHKNQAWWEARLGKHHEGTMPCSGNCRHERVSRVSSWKCRGVWPIPFGAAFAAWNGPSSEPWLIYMSKFMKYFFGGKYVNYPINQMHPWLSSLPAPTKQPRLTPQQVGSPTSRPREYRLTWNSQKSKWNAEPGYKLLCFFFGLD